MRGPFVIKDCEGRTVFVSVLMEDTKTFVEGLRLYVCDRQPSVRLVLLDLYPPRNCYGRCKSKRPNTSSRDVRDG